MAYNTQSHHTIINAGREFSVNIEKPIEAALKACGRTDVRLFDCQNLVTDSTRLCDEKAFHEIIDSPYVVKACAVIADAHEQMKQGMRQDDITEDERAAMKARFEKLKAEKKKLLPAFVFGGHSPSGKRKADCMEPSGLATMDIDHMECAPIDIYNDKIKGREKELGIALVHLSPGQEGLHVIYELKPGEPRAEANERIFNSLGLKGDPRLPEGYDKAVKDVARSSFAVPRDYFSYIDEELLFHRTDDPQKSMPTAQSSAIATPRPATPQPSTPQPSSQPSLSSIQDDMDLRQAQEIFDKVCQRMAGVSPDALDVAGRRHNNLTAVLSTGICKVVSQELMRQVVERRMPSFAQEPDCQSLVADFYGKYLEANKPLPRQLAKIRVECLNSSSTANADVDEEDCAKTWESQRLDLARKIRKRLPRGLRDTVAGLPDEKVLPVLLTVLPCAAAYASDVKVEYRDGTIQPLVLMSAIIGHSASGKSICARRLGPWMKKMDEESAKADAIEREHKKKCNNNNKNNKNKKIAQELPHVFKQKIPFTISFTMLLQRQENAQGHTLFSFCEELAVVSNTNSRGYWSDKRAFYTTGFDGGEMGQDYFSMESYSGTVRALYNWSATGTKRAFDKFFDGDSIEGGLASRVCFAEMPYHLFEPLAKEQQLSAQDIKRIAEAVEKLSTAKGTLKLKKVNAALAEWENKRIIIDMASSMPEAGDFFRKRAAVIGFRCGAVAYLLTGKETNAVVEFTVLMTEYVFQSQMHFLADKFYDNTVKANERQQRRTENGIIFDNLSQRFTLDDVKRQKPDATVHCLTQTISVWKKANWITKVAKNTWEKRVNVASLLASPGSPAVTMSLSR